MRKRQAVVCVTNDLTTDQRVDRTCTTLLTMGYEVRLVGRHLHRSLPLAPRTYGMHRMHLLFSRGPLFYANYNLMLFWFLMTHRASLIVSNDLDTLPACYLAYRLKNWGDFLYRRRGEREKPSSATPSHATLLHDCHEYFRGVPELVGRTATTRVWKSIEDLIFPRVPLVTAVNGSIAQLYSSEYGNPVTVIRNVPFRKPAEEPDPAGRVALGIQPSQRMVLYQGAVNIDRGLEEVIQAMKYVRSDARLVIAGTGDIEEELRAFVQREKVPGKVLFTGQIPFQQLHRLTLMADIGLSIEKDVSLNYRYALPNKFLDYIQARVPVLISPFPEMKAILDAYFIGEVLENHDPKHIAEKIDRLLLDEQRLTLYRQNLDRAAEELCWENEAPKLVSLLVNRDP